MEIIGLNGTTLAYIGDAVFSLQIREYLVALGYQKPNVLQKLTVGYVSAKAQASFLKYFMDNELLSEEEMVIVKRGRNSKTQSIAKNADVLTYRSSTGFEALWGYLYLQKQEERLAQLLQIVLTLGDKK
ncbi:ribonuclease-3 family protein [Breznakia sp. PF5-3]|uniref:Mini-ribonuclease 3 n=1 Tax=unclassified Breznakia TaxID=2623764 RepID=UPI002405DAEF|nr:MULTISPECIES: ribonuclease III domain-containing protein [unclassified Breznakia]MDL2276552.1 Mini-ribonuclease 3 [Breznakia sp. OttesenSCG-928-G09]MDF9825543.1 ribonuclease-3 family protein [Breznakia sp. PM6-1]MDF9836413.1 ribonuclease-3 family protein [Breznakia sp. PF5-3]MDF9838197.1 ribonuclease-3 family protein [Breznakia sp. PFB2-8]MDF9860210.1 ribonuclease-3 family protein [Breznakia sp. PH5-24]